MDDKTVKFIRKAVDLHGDKYDYSRVKYTKAIDKITIACHVHGEFIQQASEHLRGRGCRACGFERISTSDFIKNAQKVHGNRYDYSKSEFIKSIQKTTVICSIHGEFLITPNQHQNGSGCPTCSKLERGAKKSGAARKVFLRKAIEVHGDKIDFSKTVYKTAKEKAIFICKTHGEWEARPDNILHGKGCPGCRRQKIVSANLELSKEAAVQFVEKANLIHEGRYNYDKSDYKRVHEKVEIVCPEHGSFWQSPANHLSGGNGCPNCTVFGYRTSNPGWLYLQTLNEEFIKVGITNHTPERRLKEHSRNSDLVHTLINKWYFEDGFKPLEIETKIKQSFKCGVVSSEVMRDGHSETMHISDLPAVLKKIHSMLK